MASDKLPGWKRAVVRWRLSIKIILEIDSPRQTKICDPAAHRMSRLLTALFYIKSPFTDVIK